MTIFYCLTIIILSGVGDVLAKMTTQNYKIWHVITAISVWSVANYCWIMLLRSGVSMSKSYLLLALPCAMLAIFVGLYYGELLSIKQWIGIGLGALAMWCLY